MTLAFFNGKHGRFLRWSLAFRNKQTPLTSQPTPCQYNSVTYTLLAFSQLTDIFADRRLN